MISLHVSPTPGAAPHEAPEPRLAPRPRRDTWLAAAAAAALPAALAGAALLGAATSADRHGGWALASGLGLLLLAAAARWGGPRWAAARPLPADLPPDHALHSLAALDSQMLKQLDRAVGLSESAGLQVIERVNGLRALSARLMDYLGSAQTQSADMQGEIERSGAIVAELAHFVQQLPQQIAAERTYLEQLVSEVRHLSGITDTIRGMARQTEILSINAAIAAAQAGEAGRGFSVLAGEVRRLAVQSNDAAQSIDAHIRQLVTTVQARSGGEAADRLRSNEAEAARLLALTGKLDEGYLDMRQFYAMLLTAITEHNGALDRDITGLLDSAQYQDVFKQIVDRLAPAFSARHALLHTLLAEQEAPQGISDQTHAQAQALVDSYQRAEAAHSDPADTSHAHPTSGGAPLARVELF